MPPPPLKINFTPPKNMQKKQTNSILLQKRVKLAKLIIQHEGLQMLDLVVAANMGIFWKIWDR